MDQQASAKGFVALTSVILLGAIGVIVAVSFLIIGTNATVTSGGVRSSAKARALSESCAETALLQLKDPATTLPQSGSLDVDSGSCSYSLEQTLDNRIELRSSGNHGNAVRKLRIVVASTSPNMIISSYQEVADF